MEYIDRKLEPLIGASLERGKSVLLLGARQTGKTTLIKRLMYNLLIPLAQPGVRRNYEMNPASLTAEIEALAEQTPNPLVIIDEIQKVPELLDAVQDLIDRNLATFVLTGSSARKLKNLLPGRVVALHLDPLTLSEVPPEKRNLNELLMYGSLPEIVVTAKQYKELDLESYVLTYLEEEVRKEALVRNLGSFANFLKLAAAEAGNVANFRNLSQHIGISHTTIAAYYQILEDCLIVEKVTPFFCKSNQKRVTKGVKYLFYDLGIRRVSAGEGTRPPLKHFGKLFEQFVGLELIKAAKFQIPKSKIHYWRTTSGVEVDWVIAQEDSYIPVEVKWTENPTLKDAKHLMHFLEQFAPKRSGYIVCRCLRRMKVAKNIYAIPWQELSELLSEAT